MTTEPLGPWAEQHLESLKDNRPDLLRDLEKSGQLQSHLTQLDEAAENMYRLIVKDLKKQKPEPEDYMGRVHYLQRNDRIAREIVLNDLVLVPDLETEKAMRDGYVDDENDE